MRAWHALRKCLLRKMTLTELYLNQKPACEGTELGLTLLLLTRKENSNLFVWTSHWFSLNLSRWTLMGNNKVKQFYSPQVSQSPRGEKQPHSLLEKWQAANFFLPPKITGVWGKHSEMYTNIVKARFLKRLLLSKDSKLLMISFHIIREKSLEKNSDVYFPAIN